MTALSRPATMLACTAAAIAVIGATGSAAEAKGKHFKSGGFHVHHVHKHHFRRHHFYAGPVVHYGCGYEKRMWWNTGSFYWKQRYYACKGWW